MVYGYARVSTSGQELHGTGLASQADQMRREGAVEVVSEAFTGTTMARPQWDALMARLQPGDTVMVTKLDRIARTSSGGFEAVKALLDAGVKVHILNMGLIDNTPTGRLILNIMFAFAEFDRDMVVDRLASGREYRRATDPDYKEGRKRIETDTDLLRSLMEREEAGEITARDAAAQLGVSDRTYRRRKSEFRRAA